MLRLTSEARIISETEEIPSTAEICAGVADIIHCETSVQCKCVDLWDPANPPRNTLRIGKLAITPKESYHVKLIKAPDSESEYLGSVLRRFEGLDKDQYLLIPTIIPVFRSGYPDPKFYVHVTKWIEGHETLASCLIRMWFCGSRNAVKSTLCSFGKFLRNFHSRYPGLQHTDMNPNNVLMIPTTCGVSVFLLTDCAGLDDQVGDDVKSFHESLRVLADGGFGDEFLSLAISAFTDGYENP